MTTFSRYLRAAMDERGWKQSDLARASGLSPKSVSEYLNKGVTPQPDRLSDIARGLGIAEEEVRQAAGWPPSMGEFRLSADRRADAETLDAVQRQAVEEIIRLLADGNRKQVMGSADSTAPMNEPDDKVAHLRLEDRPVTRKRTPRWELDEEAANEGDDEIAVDEIPDEST